MQKTLPLIISALAAVPAFAENARQLDAHEHGVGELNIAFDGKTIAMELHAPGADIVGFEYAAESAEDRAAVDNAVAVLARPLDLFILPEGAACSVTQASATLESEAEHDDHDDEEHGHGDKHDDHAEHDHDDDKHAEHAEGEHGHEDHDEHAEEGGHTEFHAEYVLTCADPSAIDQITFAYFQKFENARELEVQIVSASGANAFEVERDAPVLDLRGMF